MVPRRILALDRHYLVRLHPERRHRTVVESDRNDALGARHVAGDLPFVGRDPDLAARQVDQRNALLVPSQVAVVDTGAPMAQVEPAAVAGGEFDFRGNRVFDQGLKHLAAMAQGLVVDGEAGVFHVLAQQRGAGGAEIPGARAAHGRHRQPRGHGNLVHADGEAYLVQGVVDGNATAVERTVFREGGVVSGCRGEPQDREYLEAPSLPEFGKGAVPFVGQCVARFPVGV